MRTFFCQKARAKSMLVYGINLGLVQAREAFVNAREGMCVFHGHCIEGAKIAAEPQLLILLLDHHDHTRPKRQRGLDHSLS